MAEILWLGGWASDLSAWSGALETLYPGRTHRFLDAHALLDGRADLAAEAGRLHAGACLAAWSLGNLLVHRALSQGWRPACRILSLSPIFDFCRPGGPWPRAAVLRMARRLPRERERVLAEFRAEAWGQSQIPGELAEAWNARARAYADESLVRGLEALAEIHLAPASVPRGCEIVFLASAEDPLSPAPPGIAADARWRAYPRGHLPFLDFPQLVGPLLPAPEKKA
jgi:hypothetical protein